MRRTRRTGCGTEMAAMVALRSLRCGCYLISRTVCVLDARLLLLLLLCVNPPCFCCELAGVASLAKLIGSCDSGCLPSCLQFSIGIDVT